MAVIDWNSRLDEAFGERLAAARGAKGWSMQQLAERLGVSKATVGHWETAKRAMKHGDLARVCSLLSVSADELLFGARRWPFEAIDFGSVAGLERADIERLEGGLLLVAAQLGLEVKPVTRDRAPPHSTAKRVLA